MRVKLENAWWDGSVLHQRGEVILPDDFDPKKLPKSAKVLDAPEPTKEAPEPAEKSDKKEKAKTAAPEPVLDL